MTLEEAERRIEALEKELINLAMFITDSESLYDINGDLVFLGETIKKEDLN